MIVRALRADRWQLFRTADLDCSRSGNFSMDLGVRLRFLAIRASLFAFPYYPRASIWPYAGAFSFLILPDALKLCQFNGLRVRRPGSVTPHQESQAQDSRYKHRCPEAMAGRLQSPLAESLQAAQPKLGANRWIAAATVE